MSRIYITITAMLLLSVNAFALQTYNFEFYTNNGNYNDSPDVKLFVDVDSYSATQVSFDFRNESTVDSVIKTIAIEQNLYLTDISYLGNHAGVNFTGGNPPNFGGLDPAFDESILLSANANSPSGLNKNGIDKGENLMILANLTSGKTYADVINGLDSDEFRIGIHVGSFPDESSEKGINGGQPPVVPVPAAAVLALIGFGCVTSLRKKIA